MGTIINLQDLDKTPNLKRPGQTLVLVGGCFDILHAAHIQFLQKANDAGDILLVLLENDKRISKLKGKGRPINSETDRATVLSNLSMVDYVLCPASLKTDQDYEALVKQIKPDIIAVTSGNRIYAWEKEYMDRAGGKIIEVIKKIPDYSTTKILKRISVKDK